MSEQRASVHGQWSSRLAFILAATGSAVGLGNIWKFPYITGENGGGAFVIVYLLCIALIGVPVLMAEVMIGRRGGQNPIAAIGAVARESGARGPWRLFGFVGILAGFLILSFYCVIAGFAMAYIFFAMEGSFTEKSPDEIAALYGAFTGSPGRVVAWMTLTMALTTAIVARGIKGGLERAVEILMPGLLIILLLLVGYALNSGKFTEGLQFLFSPDFSKLTGNAILVALGHAFFTLSLASGTMMAYGAYLPKDTSITTTSIVVAVADTVVALLAGMAIFPIVFAEGLEPAAGPGLVFQSLPIAFGEMPFGRLFGTLFFVMLTFAALTSAISLLEPSVAWVTERFKIARLKAALLAGGACWVVGLGSAFSFNIMANATLRGKDYFGIVDYLTANVMLPIGGLFVAVFSAWIVREAITKDELAIGEPGVYHAWRFVMRYITPIAIFVVFLNAIGLLALLLGN